MLKNFGIWFVCFGLSFLAESFGLASQGFAFLIIFLGTIGLIIFATWAATQLFDVDFYVAFQIMTFGQCLCTSKSQKD